jgi:DNA (cytosine-5)-methyltransferase 1
MKKHTIISLFSGCGGLDLGFLGGFTFLGKKYKKNNFNILWANDIEKNACRTYSKNFDHDIVCGDIEDIINNNQQCMFNNPVPKNIDIVLGGFPCQDFSYAGKRKGLQTKRGSLYQSMAKIIAKTQPKLFLAENVKGLLTMNDGLVIEKIVQDFKNLGYNVSYKLFLVADYEVPQKRERVLIIGTKNNELPEFVFSGKFLKAKKWINLDKAIGDLEHIEEGGFANHFWSKAKKNKGQGNSVVSKEYPGPTMRAEHHGNIEFHWNKNRRLSAREAARIQSFPDEFIFYPSTSSAYKQIGNAVPPVFSWHIANAIESFLNTHLG